MASEQSSSKQPDIIEVSDNTSAVDLSSSLFNMGAVKSSWAFYFYCKYQKITIKGGYYSIPYNLSIRDLATKMSNGDFALTKVVIPEGKRLEQIGAMLEDKHIFKYEDYVAAAKGDEGQLYPDTYYISKNDNAADLAKMMTDNFKTKTAGLNLTKDQLVLASVVQRESNKDDKPLIAGIFQNRLNIGMRLESDPTVLYANDSSNLVGINGEEAVNYTFWKPVDFSSYRSIISPYNTYINAGLPPNPICSPGIDSINAVIHSESSDYLYFLHDSDGIIHPAATNAEHEENKEKYL